MWQNHFKLIQGFLPRHPEEGGDFSLISRDQLLALLTQEFPCESVAGLKLTIDVIERIFISLCVIDSAALNNGYWKFVSHPAQLCALSLLESFTDPKQRFLPEGFWHTAGVSDDVKQQQKSVLKSLEDHRRDCRLDGSLPKPIRFIYVAWAIVKIEGKFLFHRREAKEHGNEFTLVGGRTNLQDLKFVTGPEIPISHLLQQLQSPHSEPMFMAMDRAITRELQEETHLVYPDHYQVSHYCDLKPYSQCMGAAPNYAFTQYFFRLYRIDLSTTGFFKLREAINDSQGDLMECSVSEVLAGGTIDGGRKFTFDAIYRHFDDDLKKLERFFEKAPSSYDNRFIVSGDDHGIVLSFDKPLTMGAPGKETGVAQGLSTDHKALLTALGGYAKGLPCQPAPGVIQHYYGWIEVTDESIQNRLGEIVAALRGLELPLIEVMDNRYFRLSVDPNSIFFDPCLFAFSVMTASPPSNNKIELSILRAEIATPLGHFMPEECVTPVTRPLADKLKRVVSGGVPWDDEGQLAKRVRSAAQDRYQALGLRLLLKVSNKEYVITCHTL